MLKEIFISILIASTFSGCLFGQEYINSSTKWREHHSGGGAGNPYMESFDFWRHVKEDTMIDGNQYRILEEGGYYKRWNWVLDSTLEEGWRIERTNFIRESNGKWYVITQRSNQEALLHDFELTMGDTAVSYCRTPQIVDSISEIRIDGERRKVFHFRENSLNYLIEGIGTNWGMLRQPCNEIAFEAGSRLYCIEENGDVLKIDSMGVCHIQTSIQDERESEMKIIQNPIEDFLILDNSVQYTSKVKVTVCEIGGIRIYEAELNIGLGRTQIPLEFLPSGIYLVIFECDGHREMYKIVK